jgi:hypothetical protein
MTNDQGTNYKGMPNSSMTKWVSRVRLTTEHRVFLCLIVSEMGIPGFQVERYQVRTGWIRVRVGRPTASQPNWLAAAAYVRPKACFSVSECGVRLEVSRPCPGNNSSARRRSREARHLSSPKNRKISKNRIYDNTGLFVLCGVFPRLRQKAKSLFRAELFENNGAIAVHKDTVFQ